MSRITVVIPAYNAAAHIATAVKSALEQPNVDVVVVNDGSTDETRDVVTAIDGVQLIDQPNGGAGKARNRGVSTATADWVAFLDSDDALLPGWAEHLRELIVPGVGVVCCGVTVCDTHGGAEHDRLPKSMGPAYDGFTACFLPGGYAVRRDLFELAGGFAADVRYGEHHELALRLAAICTEHGQTMASVMTSLVLKNHDRGREAVASYHHARLEAVEIKLARHADRFALDPSLLADYQGVAAFSAASTGQWSRARKWYLGALRAKPGRWKDYGRLLVTYLPGVRDRVWS